MDEEEEEEYDGNRKVRRLEKLVVGVPRLPHQHL